MAPHTINTTVAGRQLGKKIICWTPANISSLITSATNNNARVQMSTASVELVFNMSTILLYDTLQATPPLVDTDINEHLWQCAPLQQDRLIVLMSRSRIDNWYAPTFAGKFLQKAARVPVLFCHNAFKAILSSRVISAIKMLMMMIVSV